MKKGGMGVALLAVVIAVAIGFWLLREDATVGVVVQREPSPAVAASAYRLSRNTAAPVDAGAALVAADAGAVTSRLALHGSVVHEGKMIAATVHIGPAVISSGSDGRFAWEGLVGETGVNVWAERGALRSARINISAGPRPAQVQLVLQQPIRLVGRILGNPGRQPIAAMKVSVDGEDLVTDAKGAFATDQVVPGFVVVSLEGDDDWAPHWQTFHLEPGRVNEVELTLSPFQAISGRVVTASQLPVAGANVRLEALQTGEKRVAVTAADGTFGFTRVAPAAYAVVADHASGRSRPIMTWPLHDLTLVLEAAATLQVTVTRKAGPVANLEVSLTTNGKFLSTDARLTTNAQGLVRFEGLATSTWTVWAREGKAQWHALGSTTTKPGLNAFSGEFKDDGKRVKFEVLDAVDRSPIGGAAITIDNLTQTTDDEGVSVFEDLDSEDNTKVTVVAEGYPEKSFSMMAADTEGDLLMDRWRMLRGSAVDRDDRPVRDLIIASQRVDTDLAGGFEMLINGSDAETSWLFQCAGCKQVKVKVPAGQTDVDIGKIVFGESGVFHFVVTTPDGKPAAFARLFKVEGEKPFLTREQRKTPRLVVDALGEARVHSSEPSCSVAALDGYAPSSRESCPHAAQPGQTLKIELRLRRAAYVEGTVRRHGLPVPNELVGDLEEDVLGSTDTRGRYRLGPLSPGPHFVGIIGAGDGFTAAFKNVKLTEGATQTIDFGPEATARVTIEWLGPPSVTHAIVILGHLDRAQVMALKPETSSSIHVQPLDPSQAVFDSLEEGEWTAFVGERGGPMGLAWFTVTRGQDLRVPVKPESP